MQKKQTQADVGDDLRHYFHILAPTICNNKRQVNSNFCCNKNWVFWPKYLVSKLFWLGISRKSQDLLRYHRLINRNGYINAGIRERKLIVSTYKRGKNKLQLDFRFFVNHWKRVLFPQRVIFCKT
jgi:hypothetical protein